MSRTTKREAKYFRRQKARKGTTLPLITIDLQGKPLSLEAVQAALGIKKE